MAAIVFDELDRELVEELLQGTNLFAPLLLDYEMASVCLKKIRLVPADRNGLIAAFDRFSTLPITRVANDMEETIALAMDNKLSLYDASYLWLARSLDVELVTLDDKLKR